MTNSKMPDFSLNYHQVLPTLKEPSLHHNGNPSHMSMRTKDIILVIPAGRQGFKTKQNLEKILKFTEELINDK
jgi:hypothetical protein